MNVTKVWITEPKEPNGIPKIAREIETILEDNCSPPLRDGHYNDEYVVALTIHKINDDTD